MLKQLRLTVEIEFGKPIQNSLDCFELSQSIFSKTGKTLGHNTLRRIFEVIKDQRAVRKSTLDILCNYIGYPHYNEFVRFQKETLYLERLALLYKPNKCSMIKRLELIKDLPNSIVMATQMAREDLITGRNEGFLEIMHWINEQTFNYYEILYFGNSIGQILRQQKDLHFELLTNVACFKNLICIFVDYSHLNDYYGKVIAHYYQSPKLMLSDYIFCEGILILKSFLNDEKIEKPFPYYPIKEFHPILNSRIIASHLLQNNDAENTQRVLRNYSEFLEKEAMMDQFETYYEIMTVSLLLKNKYVFNWLENQKLDEIIYVNHQFHYQLLWKLVKLYFAYLKGTSLNFELEFKSIDPHYFRNSYFDLIHFFYLGLKVQLQLANQSETEEYHRVKSDLKYSLIEGYSFARE